MKKVGKKKNKQSFYRVRVKLDVGENAQYVFEGIFFPKNDTCTTGVIKKQCWEHLKKELKTDGDIDIDGLHKTITVNPIPWDFLVKEDEEWHKK